MQRIRANPLVYNVRPCSEFACILECITTYNRAANSCESLSLVTWEVRIVVTRFQRPERVVDDPMVGFVCADVQDDIFHCRFGLEKVNNGISVQPATDNKVHNILHIYPHV